ncbi:MAG: hypothetical protein NVSMB42_01020 [Herpetosiphon sp.]
MNHARQLWIWTRFLIVDYARSGRILVEAAITVAFWGVFFQTARSTIPHLFSMTGILGMVLALYTTSSFLGLADRAQSYLILTRPLGRRGFLMGLYLAALLVVLGMITLLVVLVVMIRRPVGLLPSHLWFGLLPIMLNVALLAAVMLLMSSLVVRNGPRLVILALLAVALYSNTWNLSPAYRFIEPFQALFSRLVQPAIEGQRLAVSRDYAEGGVFVLLSQLGLTLLLVSLASLSFVRRELVLGKK